MKKRILFCILLVGLLCALIPQFSLGSVAAQASSGRCGDQLTWSFDPDSGTLSITGTGDMWDYDVHDRPWSDILPEITAIVLSEGVTSIGSTAFYDAVNVSSVSLPSSLKTIGSHAFALCISLRSISIPYGVSRIEDNAFMCCVFLESITVPDSVIFLGESAFASCNSLRSAILSSGLTELSRELFASCTLLEEVSLPTELEIIGSGAFNGCSYLNILNLPDGLTYVGDMAFYNCSCLSVYLPDSVKIIGADAFYGSFDYEYFVNMGDPYLYSGKHLIAAGPSVSGDITISQGTLSIAGGAFFQNQGITSVTIPRSVKGIGPSAFAQCGSLSSATIPDTVEVIRGEIFDYTPFYENSANWVDDCFYVGNHLLYVKNTAADPVIVRPGTVTVAAGAFDSCKGFKALILPQSLRYINEGDLYHTDPNDSFITSFEHVCILNPHCTMGQANYRPELPKITFYGHPNSTTQAYAEKTEQAFVPFCSCWLMGSRYGTEILDPTCNVQGQINFYCYRCTNTVPVYTIPALKHDFTQYEDLGSHHKVTCSRCEEFYTQSHSYTDDICICGGLKPDAALRFRTISLKGNIAINYYMELTEAISEDETAYMLFTMENGEQIKVPATQAEPTKYQGVDYYVFSCELSAKEMTDTVTCRFFHAGGQTDTYTYSIKTYADNILKSSTDEALRELIYAMLNYGAASQIHFGYRTDRLANEGLETPDYTAITIEGFPINKNQGTSLATFAGASLLLTSETTLRFFFQVDASVEEAFTVSYEGKTLPLGSRWGMYYADIPNISAKDLDNSFTMVINDGKETAEVSYSPLSYCASVIENPNGVHDRQLQDCAAAIYLYNQAANDYFGQ